MEKRDQGEAKIKGMKSDGHSYVEDGVAIVTGACFVALGVLFLQSCHLASGGITGMTLVTEHLVNIPFSVLFIVLNLPFFLLALLRMGKVFALSSFIGASLVSVVNEVLNMSVEIDISSPYIGGVIGGFLMGVGMLMLFRHRCSIGGFNILAIYLQEKGVISAGKIQLLLDISVLIFLGITVDIAVIVPTALSVLALNVVLIMNHKDGRYSVSYGGRSTR